MSAIDYLCMAILVLILSAMASTHMPHVFYAGLGFAGWLLTKDVPND